jgi:hypothetical protein
MKVDNKFEIWLEDHLIEATKRMSIKEFEAYRRHKKYFEVAFEAGWNARDNKIIRCIDCAHNINHFCKKNERYVPNDWYCPVGKRSK